MTKTDSRARPLGLPFTARRFFVEEGWLYSRGERAIHHLTTHRGIDFRLKPGTPVVSSADGYAVASYQHSLRYYRNKVLAYRNKPVGFGYGYLIVVYHPSLKKFTLYGHLSRVSTGLKFVRPVGKWPSHRTAVLRMGPAQLLRGSKVRAGQLLGWSGDSGCTWGYKDYPSRPDRRTKPSWDGPHLHFEVFFGHGGGKRKYYDPFGLYGGHSGYPRRIPREGIGLWHG